jgi:hypothetical protein
MIHILKRSYPTFLVYYVFVIVLLTGIRLLLGSELNVLFTLMSGIVLFMYSFGALMISEQYEEKHRGYAILSALPVSKLEITTAKFLLPAAGNAALVISLMLLFSTFSAPAQDMMLVRSYFLLMASAALLAAGLLYIGIFGIDYTKFVVVVLSLATALGLLVPMLFLKANQGRMDVVIENLLAWIRGLNWLLLLPLLLLAYLGLMGLALQVRVHREIQIRS